LKFLEKNNFSWNTVEDKHTTMQPTWIANIVLYKIKFYIKTHWHFYAMRMR
jgi:hypothetical protein